MGQKSGVIQRLKNEGAPALRVRCDLHVLSLSISKASKAAFGDVGPNSEMNGVNFLYSIYSILERDWQRQKGWIQEHLSKDDMKLPTSMMPRPCFTRWGTVTKAAIWAAKYWDAIFSIFLWEIDHLPATQTTRLGKVIDLAKDENIVGEVLFLAEYGKSYFDRELGWSMSKMRAGEMAERVLERLKLHEAWKMDEGWRQVFKRTAQFVTEHPTCNLPAKINEFLRTVCSTYSYSEEWLDNDHILFCLASPNGQSYAKYLHYWRNGDPPAEVYFVFWKI